VQANGTGTLAETRDLFTNFYTFEGVVHALNGVSIVVRHGETYGLVGESGCGKSVTVRSLMRIVQAPGRIDSGAILLFLGDGERQRGVEILARTETYMQSIRGSDISMIFQEPGTALNPVLSVRDQVGESFRLHRMVQMIEETLQDLEGHRASLGGADPRRAARAVQIALLKAEAEGFRRYDARVRRIDGEIADLEGREDADARARRQALNAARDRARPRGGPSAVARRVPFLRLYRRPLDATIRRHVVELLRSLGIPNPENVAERYPHELSGGMQQRIVIAMALACHPTLLVADEPTSNLDVTIQAQIVELIKDLKRSTITSVLFITHDLGLVAEVCDRVTVMYAGDVSETASVRELFARPLHPYTQGLLASVPKVEQQEELSMIAGAVPNLIHPPAGCRFHPRCPRRMDVCAREKPPTVEHSPDHWVACHLYPPPGAAPREAAERGTL
jgi:peptide/nickel transport system ATP-binding protein